MSDKLQFVVVALIIVSAIKTRRTKNVGQKNKSGHFFVLHFFVRLAFVAETTINAVVVFRKEPYPEASDKLKLVEHFGGCQWKSKS